MPLSAYTLEPCRSPFRAVPVACVNPYSSDQRLVGQPLPGHAVNEAVEAVERVPLNVALVEPESELAHVPTQMLFADMMVGAIDAALQERPDGSDAVDQNAVARSNAAGVSGGPGAVGDGRDGVGERPVTGGGPGLGCVVAGGGENVAE